MVPYIQPYTLKNSTYGLLVPDYHTQAYGTPAKYLRVNVIKDVSDLVQEWTPNQVYVHSGADWELDHRAVFRFVRDAFQALGLASRVNTFYNDYGIKANGPCQVRPDCHAPVQVAPTDQQAEGKYQSLLKYHSQIEPIFASAQDFKSMGLYNFSLRQEDFWPVDFPMSPREGFSIGGAKMAVVSAFRTNKGKKA